MKKEAVPKPAPTPKGIERIHRELATMDLACSGTLSTRMKRCGKPNCRCATDPDAAHGPYYEWSRREQGRNVCTMISPDKAKRLQEAIANYHRVQALLQDWDQRSRRIILDESHH